MKNYSIAIDGPAGAGKSSVAKAVAKELGYIYIDTGAMYRAIGLKSLEHSLDTKNDIDKIISLADDTDIKIKYIDGVQNIFTDGKNVSSLIRTNEVSIAASDVSAIPAVRLKLVEIQRDLAKTENVIMDGRDIGTYVLPDADVKIFMTASIDERTERRYKELLEKGIQCNYNQLREEIAFRDKQDSEREFAPLKQADDAVLLDTTGCGLEESINLVKKIINDKIGL